MAVVCATSEKNGLVKKSTAVKLKASDYVGLPKYLILCCRKHIHNIYVVDVPYVTDELKHNTPAALPTKEIITTFEVNTAIIF